MRKKTILVIDDEPAISKMIKRLLERENYKVDTAIDGDEAMLLLSRNIYDMIITDIIMPKKEGIEVITSVKKLYPGTKIIAMSGGGRFAPEGYLKAADILGADKIFKKPFDHKEMLRTVNTLLNDAGTIKM